MARNDLNHPAEPRTGVRPEPGVDPAVEPVRHPTSAARAESSSSGKWAWIALAAVVAIGLLLWGMGDEAAEGVAVTDPVDGEVVAPAAMPETDTAEAAIVVDGDTVEDTAATETAVEADAATDGDTILVPITE